MLCGGFASIVIQPTLNFPIHAFRRLGHKELKSTTKRQNKMGQAATEALVLSTHLLT